MNNDYVPYFNRIDFAVIPLKEGLNKKFKLYNKFW